jgi:hypothetical protein
MCYHPSHKMSDVRQILSAEPPMRLRVLNSDPIIL